MRARRPPKTRFKLNVPIARPRGQLGNGVAVFNMTSTRRTHPPIAILLLKTLLLTRVLSDSELPTETETSRPLRHRCTRRQK